MYQYFVRMGRQNSVGDLSSYHSLFSFCCLSFLNVVSLFFVIVNERKSFQVSQSFCMHNVEPDIQQCQIYPEGFGI